MKLKHRGKGPYQTKIVTLLKSFAPLTSYEIAKVFGIQRNTVGDVLGEMERRGLVKRCGTYMDKANLCRNKAFFLWKAC